MDDDVFTALLPGAWALGRTREFPWTAAYMPLTTEVTLYVDWTNLTYNLLTKTSLRSSLHYLLLSILHFPFPPFRVPSSPSLFCSFVLSIPQQLAMQQYSLHVA